MFQFKQNDANTYIVSYKGKEISRLNINKFNVANRPFIFPVYTPAQKLIVRRYPMEKVEGETHDHPHHTGVWTAWGSINGVDNWAFGPKCGKQHVKSVQSEVTSKGLQVVMDVEWTTPTDVPQLAERRTILIHDPDQYFKSDFGSNAVSTTFVYDFTVEFTTKFGPIKFGDTKEGGLLSVRVPTALDVPKGKIENSRGGISTKKEEEKIVWGKKAEWCSYSGKVEDSPVGIAILAHPSNPIAPTYWHVRNYGLMTANPFGKSHFVFPLLKGHFRMKANTTTTWKYRLVIYDGTTVDAQLPKHYELFVK